jgi:hypothetical protein
MKFSLTTEHPVGRALCLVARVFPTALRRGFVGSGNGAGPSRAR